MWMSLARAVTAIARNDSSAPSARAGRSASAAAPEGVVDGIADGTACERLATVARVTSGAAGEASSTVFVGLDLELERGCGRRGCAGRFDAGAAADGRDP